MTPPVFVVDPDDLAHAAVGGLVRVDGPEGRHAAGVRRLSVGEPVSLVDGRGTRADGTVVAVVDRSAIDVQVTDHRTEPDPSPRIVVVQALPKGDRGELAVELLTEVGVDAIVPWAAAQCVTQWRPDRRERAHRRWADAAHAAAKQARRARFPVVEPLASTDEVAARVRAAALSLVLHESATRSLAGQALPASGEVVIVVGPEGGLTGEELSAFEACGANTVRLGPTVLRTSSAGLAAVSALLAPSPRWAPPANERMTP